MKNIIYDFNNQEKNKISQNENPLLNIKRMEISENSSINK